MNTGINAINEAVKEASAFTHPLFNELGKVIIGQNYLTERLVGLMLEFGHGDANEWARLCHIAAERAEGKGEFLQARDYYQRAAESCKAAGNSGAEGAARRALAEALVKEAQSAIKQPGRGSLDAASIQAQAVDAMRQAPGGKVRAHSRMASLTSTTLACECGCFSVRGTRAASPSKR